MHPSIEIGNISLNPVEGHIEESLSPERCESNANAIIVDQQESLLDPKQNLYTPKHENSWNVQDIDSSSDSSNNHLQSLNMIYCDVTMMYLLARKKNDAEAWLSWDQGYRDKISLSL
jgi:hypothetical protein